MAIQFLQSLWVTSYIQRVMGVAAYGYIAVIVNLVNMAGIVTVALTSVCSRFIVIELEGKDCGRINQSFNTVFYALAAVAAACVPAFLILAFHITEIMNVSEGFAGQVSVLMLVVGFDFIVQLLQVPFLSVFYYEERMYYNYLVVILSNFAKMAVVLVLFTVWQPVVWGAYIGALFINIAALWAYYKYVRRHYPQIKANIVFFQIQKLKEILRMGIWVSFSKLAAVLLSSSSTYLANIWLGVYLAGIYGSVAQIQSILSFITVSVVNIFLPQMYKLYASGQKAGLAEYTTDGLKILSMILGIVVGGLMVFGDIFMGLWISKTYLAYRALLVVCVCYLANAYAAEILNQLFVTIGKTKTPALVSVLAGVVNVVLAAVFIKRFDMGVYGLALAQLAVFCVRSGIWMPVYAARCLNYQWNFFIKKQLACVLSMVVTGLTGWVFRYLFAVNSWGMLVLGGVFTGSLSAGAICILDQDIRKFAVGMLKRR